MNDADFYDGMARNEEFYAKRQARSDYAYLKEARKLNNQNNMINTPDNAYDTRLARIEERLDNLYRLFSNTGNIDNIVNQNGKLFVLVSKSNVMSDTSITLTDRQFEDLMNRILR